MLDHLDLLDDAAPFDVDATTLADVHARANTLRRRSRITSFGAAVAVVLVVAGVATIARTRDHEVKVVGKPSTTSAPVSKTNRTSEGTLPDGLHVKMTVETSTVVLGGDVAMTVEVRNDTNQVRPIGGRLECGLNLAPLMRDSAGRDVYREGVPSCFPAAGELRPGATVVVPAAITTYPVVLPNGRRRGRYEVGLARPGPGKSGWVLPPVGIEVVAPDLRGKLEITRNNFAPGETLNGTLVIDNASSDPVEYPFQGACFSSWTVALGKDGVAFSTPMPEPSCVRINEHNHLPVGTSRFPFSVLLTYTGCTVYGSPSTASPSCSADGSAPSLEPGDYQLLFSGRGAFGVLDISPESIQVR